MRFNGIGPMVALICLAWALIPVKAQCHGLYRNKESHEMDLGPMLL
jgi:hypothetical protein